MTCVGACDGCKRTALLGPAPGAPPWAWARGNLYCHDCRLKAAYAPPAPPPGLDVILKGPPQADTKGE